jgi:hypothetical protein
VSRSDNQKVKNKTLEAAKDRNSHGSDTKGGGGRGVIPRGVGGQAQLYKYIYIYIYIFQNQVSKGN